MSYQSVNWKTNPAYRVDQIRSGGLITVPEDNSSVKRFSYNPTPVTRYSGIRLTPYKVSRKPLPKKRRIAKQDSNDSVKKAGMYGSIGALMVIATASLIWIAAKKS